MQQKLIDLMCKFELAYKLTNGDYMAPQLLPGDYRHDIPWRGNQQNLFFVYQYGFMPRGILSRLIVRLHSMIYEEVRWYSGVFLEWGGTRALVREDRARSRIVIRLEGSDLRGLLAIVRREVEEIHASFGPKLPVEEKVPCNCETCTQRDEPYFYAFKNLESRISAGRQEIDCEYSPHHSVNIQALLSAVSIEWDDRDNTMGHLSESQTPLRDKQ